MTMSIRKMIIIATSAIALIVLSSMLTSLFETNNAGEYKIKQAAVSGRMSVRTTPGTYWQGFGDITPYQISDMYYFSKYDDEGGKDRKSDAIQVRFNDGGTAKISGSVKYRLSLKPEDQLLLHQDFKSYKAVKEDLIRQVVTEALMQTATLMKAEESYSTRRAEFSALAEEQVRRGLFEVYSKEIRKDSSKKEDVVDSEDGEFIERVVRVKKNEDGTSVIKKKSPFSRYNIELIQFVVKEIDFDETIDALIAKKKEAEQQKVVARANAEKAKQDAITAAEKGKAAVAEAEAKALVEKKTAVVEAEKKFEVAKFARQRAEEDAAALLVKRKAEAKANQLLVQAGLTPLERATIEKDTAIGVAKELANVKFPEMMIIGGSGNSGQVLDPFQAVGLESFIKISKELSNKKSVK